ncbi:MAG: enolase C-terminal domain-like protein [Pseudomonadota bacterium]|nr:enolase C-terminal domain-like protein [Pseudomonadota bacterium]
MRIVKVRHASAPLASEMANAFINFRTMTTNVVAVETDAVRDGAKVIGYGFSSNGRYAQPGLLASRFLPRLFEADPAGLRDDTGENISPQAVWRTVMSNEKPGGHGERSYCIGALDMAVWDAHAKIAGKPLWNILSEKYNGGKYDEKVLVYPGGGYYRSGKDIEQLTQEMQGYREQGYRICKMKVGAVPLKDDMKRVEAAAKALGSGENLAVDVNGRFTLEEAIAFGNAVEPLRLAWYEEPGDPLDYHLNARLIEAYPHAIATGENLFSHQDMNNLLRFGGMRPNVDWAQPDPSLCYGLTECLVMLDEAEKLGWSRRRFLPHGGHQLGLNMAAGLQLGGSESYPGVFAPYGGFAENMPIRDGYATLPKDQPGIGMELKPKLMDEMRKQLELA